MLDALFSAFCDTPHTARRPTLSLAAIARRSTRRLALPRSLSAKVAERPPSNWWWLAAGGLATALVALARGRTARRLLADTTAHQTGVVTVDGAIFLDDGQRVPLPADARVPVGPVVLIPSSPIAAATYRAVAELGAARLLPGTPDDVRMALADADAARFSMALALTTLSSAPLAAAVFM